MEKIKNAPLKQAICTVYFDNNIKIVEEKNIYHEKIKEDFPRVMFPENKNLKYPLGDIDFFSSKFEKKIQLNANACRFIETQYRDFNDFKVLLKAILIPLTDVYKIEKFTSFDLTYENIITLSENIGKEFKDYFTINYDFKTEKEKKFLGIFGSFAFNIKDKGLLSVDFKPSEPGTGGGSLEKYQLNLSFLSRPLKPIDKDSMLDILTDAHDYIDDFFVSILTKKYFEFIKK